VPQSDVSVLDPIWTTAYVTRNHGYMIFDTLFGTDTTFKPSPQTTAGMTTEDDGKRVRIVLRDGLKDGVRSRCREQQGAGRAGQEAHARHCHGNPVWQPGWRPARLAA
jgi:hypothetical protein